LILSDNCALCNCAKALDIECNSVVVSSSTTSSSGLLSGLLELEAIIKDVYDLGSFLGRLSNPIDFKSCLHWKYSENHPVHTRNVGIW
ncbi:593_t:CDS:2, partial [Gigaspora rosea]